MSSEVEQAVREEVAALHEFFVGWFSGSLSESAFESQFLQRFSETFLLIPPAGDLLGLTELAAGVRAGHGSNTEFRIAIRNVRVRHVVGDYVLATYEEWQRNALASTPPDNARIATVLFRRTERLEWLHVHETWLPPSVTTADQFDF